MYKLIFLSVAILFNILMSCSSNNEQELIPPNNNNVTYNGTIKAIIDSNCLNCHTNPPINGAPMSLTSYQNVKESVENRNLIGRVEDGTMPPSGNNLSTAQIKAIKDWQSGGFKE